MWSWRWNTPTGSSASAPRLELVLFAERAQQHAPEGHIRHAGGEHILDHSIYSHNGYQKAQSSDYDNERAAQKLIQELTAAN